MHHLQRLCRADAESLGQHPLVLAHVDDPRTEAARHTFCPAEEPLGAQRAAIKNRPSVRSKHTGDVVQPRRRASQRAGLSSMSTYQVGFQLAQCAPKLDQRRHIAVWPDRPHQAPHRQPGDPCAAELVGENAGRSGDHSDVMAKIAQLERKLAHMALCSAKNVAAGEHMNDLHARPRRSFSRVSSDAG